LYCIVKAVLVLGGLRRRGRGKEEYDEVVDVIEVHCRYEKIIKKS
jgi:hypothetical protein